MKTASWPIDKPKPYANNPRKNDGAVDKVAASIEAFGFRQPIVVDSDGVVVVGHTRLKAAQKLGMKKVPVHVAEDLTPEQARAYRLADNRVAEEAEWDAGLLMSEVDALLADGIDADLLGFDDGELDAMLAAEPEPEVEEDDVPALTAAPVTKPGDLWLLGEHRLLCGDSTKAEDVAAVMGGGKADAMLTDPPYGVAYVGKTSDALVVENDALDEESLAVFIGDAFDHAQASCRAGAYWYATVPPGPLHTRFAEDWKRRGVLRQIMVWVKDTMVLGHSEYHYQHEPILFGWVPGKRHKNSDRTRTTVWECDRPKASREHPTMKPVELWARAIKDGSRKGEVIYDPFLGSGTTLIAAEQLGRKCYGIEISPAYCDVIFARWEAMTGRKAKRITGDKWAEGTPASVGGEG